MKELASGVWRLSAFPGPLINVYLAEDVLIDAATRHSGRRILRDLGDRKLSAHALTHAHPDHQGASHEICEKLDLPLWCGERDADATEDPRLIGERQPDHALTQFFVRAFAGPAHPVARRLHEGDEVAGFNVIDVPGHSAGHVAYWRESDGVLIIGDVVTNMDVVTGIPGIHEPKPFLTPDPAENRRSIRKVAALNPSMILPGHGGPITDMAKFQQFVEKLP